MLPFRRGLKSLDSSACAPTIAPIMRAYAFVAPTAIPTRRAGVFSGVKAPIFPNVPSRGHFAARPVRVSPYAAATTPPSPPASTPRSKPASGASASASGSVAADGALRYPEPKGRSAQMTLRTRGCNSIPEIWQGLAEEVGDGVAVVDEHHPGKAIKWTFSELKEKIDVMSAGMQRLGVKSGECVAMFAENSARWLVVDQGVMATGAVSAVRGVDAPVKELIYIYGHSRSGALVVENEAVLKKLVDGGFDFRAVKFAVLLWGSADDVNVGTKVYSFEDVLAKGSAPSPQEKELNMRRSGNATILYTSGTTGLPKGVVLTHGNLLAQLDRICIGDIDPLPGDVFVSVLPCWHIFERTASYYCFTKGMEVVYSNKRRFRDDLTKHRPHVLIAVPRVFENLYGSIRAKLEQAE